MLKLGIWKIEQLRPENLVRWGMRKRVAIDLYDAAAEKSDDERNWMQEAVLRNFGSGNHTFKLTFRDRFAAFDHEVEQRLPQLLPR